MKQEEFMISEKIELRYRFAYKMMKTALAVGKSEGLSEWDVQESLRDAARYIWNGWHKEKQE